MRNGIVEPIILKGVNTYISGYPTDSALSVIGSYKVFNGLFVSLQPILHTDEEIEVFANGSRMSARNYVDKIQIESLWQPYPNANLNIRNYLKDSSNNILGDLLACKFHYIQKVDGKYNYVPSTVTDYETKNRRISIKPSFEQNEGMVRVIIEAYTDV